MLVHAQAPEADVLLAAHGVRYLQYVVGGTALLLDVIIQVRCVLAYLLDQLVILVQSSIAPERDDGLFPNLPDQPPLKGTNTPVNTETTPAVLNAMADFLAKSKSSSQITVDIWLINL